MVGTPDAIQASNAVVDRAQRVMDAATSPSASRGRLRRFILGEKWSLSDVEAFRREAEDLTAARRRLAQLARDELGVEMAELFYDEEHVGRLLSESTTDVPPPVG